MKISELIEELETLKEEHGDLPVRKKDHGRVCDLWKRFKPFVAEHKDIKFTSYQNLKEGDKFMAIR